MTAADWNNWAGGTASAAQLLAIAGGALWAYFKYLRGRTFAARAELTIAPTVG